jgi:hypothetical protein
MNTIEFNPEELELFRELLEREQNELEFEVARTDTREFKELLKHRRAVLEHVLAKLPAVPVAG